MKDLSTRFLTRELLQLVERLFLALRPVRARAGLQTDRGAARPRRSAPRASDSRELEHRCLLGLAGADMAVDETAMLLELGERDLARCARRRRVRSIFIAVAQCFADGRGVCRRVEQRCDIGGVFRLELVQPMPVRIGVDRSPETPRPLR